MTVLDYRFAQETDLESLAILISTAYRGGAEQPGWTHEAHLLRGNRIDATGLRGELAIPDTRMIVVGDSAAPPRGCFLIRRVDPETAYFGLFAVRPREQGHGLGRALLEIAETEAARLWSVRRMEMIVLGPRAELLAYYHRRGYAPTGEVGVLDDDIPRTEFGQDIRLDLVTLARDLSPTA